MGEMAKRRYGIKFVRFVVAVVLSVGSVYACGCIEPSVQAKKDHAEVIFSRQSFRPGSAEKCSPSLAFHQF